MVGPLDGVRVLELPAIGPVPFLGMLLADLGATVTRIDRLPGSGRGLDLGRGPLDRGRRSIAMDLRARGAARVALRLVERSDVLIEGFRPGVAERLGLGPVEALATNPALVYGRMTGWGQDGPLAARAGHDITYLALSGALHGIGEDGRPPVPPVNYVADLGGGAMVLATGILAALLHARATGQGQLIDAAMMEGAAYLTTMTRQLLGQGRWQDTRGHNLLDGGAPHYRCYRCADGRYVAVGALEPEFWDELVRGLGERPQARPYPAEQAGWPATAGWLADRFATRSRDDWAELFADTDGCVAPVLSLTEAPRHPQHRARHSFIEVDGCSVAGPVPRFSATPAEAGAVARAGADTEAVLDELGVGPSEREQLRVAGAISGDPGG